MGLLHTQMISILQTKMRIYKVEDKTLVVEKDLHDELMIEVIKYFEAAEIWETKGWDYKGLEARNALSNIRAIARRRRMEIQEKRKLRPKKSDKKKGESNE